MSAGLWFNGSMRERWRAGQDEPNSGFLVWPTAPRSCCCHTRHEITGLGNAGETRLESLKLKTCCEQVKSEEAQRVERWVRGSASLGSPLGSFSPLARNSPFFTPPAAGPDARSSVICPTASAGANTVSTPVFPRFFALSAGLDRVAPPRGRTGGRIVAS